MILKIIFYYCLPLDPLSEHDKKMIVLDENENEARLESKKFKTLPGINLPVDSTVTHQLELFKSEKCNYIQFLIDMSSEKITLDRAFDELNADSLANEIPNDKGRFHLYRYDHVFEGEAFRSIIFIYSMPGFVCTGKERMLYSSCKSELLCYLKTQNICPVKTLEVGEPSEITSSFLIDELHPKKFVIFKTENVRGPNSPGLVSRGPRRVTFHEDSKADNSWINSEFVKESKSTIPLKPRAPLAPATPAATQPVIDSVSYVDSLLHTILHNNLFYVLLFGMLLISLSILFLRTIANKINN